MTVTKSERGKVPMMKIIEMTLNAKEVRCNYFADKKIGNKIT